MAEKTSTQGAAGRAPTASEPGRIRNIVLVGHSGAGKTALVEALLVATGTIPRAGRVEDGTTVSDFDEAEARQQRSISLSLAPLEHDGVKVNLLDSPGYADFVGDFRAGLRAADAALFVVSAAEGIDGTTRMIWDECASVGMPRAVVITRLDSPRADFEATLAACQEAFGDGVLPLYLPLHGDDESVAGLIGLLSQQVIDYFQRRQGATRPRRRAPAADHRASQRADRGDHRRVRGRDADRPLPRRRGDRRQGPHRRPGDRGRPRRLPHPVLAACAGSGLGMAEVLEVLVNGFPSPVEHPLLAVTRPDGSAVEPLTCDPSGRLCAEVVKTTTDPYVGRISLVKRVFSGATDCARTPSFTCRAITTASPTCASTASRGPRRRRRWGRCPAPLGKALQASSRRIAGDICAIAKLSRAETGDTLSTRDDPLLVEAWDVPEPLLPVAIAAEARPTRTSCRPACSGSSPRSRRSGSNATSRPRS